MDHVFCSGRCRVSNMGAGLRSGLMFVIVFLMDVVDESSEGGSPPGKRARGGPIALFQRDEFSLFCCQHHLWMMGAFCGMKTKGFKSLCALKSKFIPS